MVDVEQGIGLAYWFRLRTQQRAPLKPNPRDILMFHVTVTVQYHRNNIWDAFPSRTSTIFNLTMPVFCESFFENNNNDFIRSILSNPLCSPFFVPQFHNLISQRIVGCSEQLIQFSSDHQSAHSESQQEFPLALDIMVRVLENDVNNNNNNDDEEEEIIEESEVIEESMQESVRMIPASKEAIQCLKTFTDSVFLKSENCNICMERFQAEDNKLSSSSSMPCGHVFHHKCILKWLQISHNCPLCRYPLSTAKD